MRLFSRLALEQNSIVIKAENMTVRSIQKAKLFNRRVVKVNPFILRQAQDERKKLTSSGWLPTQFHIEPDLIIPFNLP